MSSFPYDSHYDNYDFHHNLIALVIFITHDRDLQGDIDGALES
jgi:hypothetical protein